MAIIRALYEDRKINMKQRFPNNFTRLVSLLLAFCCFCSLLCSSACSLTKLNNAKENALQINGVPIGDDVFTYFLDAAMAKQKDYNAALNEALAKTSTYFKENSLIHKEGLSLSTAEKAAVSEKVNAYWSFYGSYYTKIGITKETLTKVFTAESYRTALLSFYYGGNGSEAVGDAALYAYFQTNYIVFKVITGYFTYKNDAGRAVPIARDDIESLAIKFQNMANLINLKEKTMDDAADFVKSTGYTGSVTTVVLKKGTGDYPSGFFEKVQAADADKAIVIGTTEYIFLVTRLDATPKSSYYTKKKSEILNTIMGSSIDEKIESSLTAAPKISEQRTKVLYHTIEGARTK